jgi:hypothetical protein
MAEILSVSTSGSPVALDWAIITYLEQRQARSPEHAVAYIPPRPGERRRLERLQERGVVVETPAGLFYLNDDALDRRSERYRRLMFGFACLLGGGAVISLAAALLGYA